VVFTGPPGSGTSTLLRLLGGTLDPLKGDILLDGQPLSDIPRAALVRSLGYVSDSPCFFEGSVADNVRLWDEGISDALVEQALADACLDDVVTRRGGADVARVDNDARNFGGGERQRLALARALARGPSILLLDDPTSALDPALAARVDTNLRRRKVTTVIATRDPRLIRSADLVLSLDGGSGPVRRAEQRAARPGGTA